MGDSTSVPIWGQYKEAGYGGLGIKAPYRGRYEGLGTKSPLLWTVRGARYD